MGLRIGALIVDSQDPGRLARFWAEVLDWVISQDEDPEWVVEPPEGSREDCVVADLLFIKVPEMPIRRRSEHSGYSGTRPTSRFTPQRDGPDGRRQADVAMCGCRRAMCGDWRAPAETRKPLRLCP
ncbi:VOC family protein [Nonomuraea turcica]|uniref:VOC family protein n=1 Tax=Nonomuraea sp. G32 TaxID=3067274 RepID=UPI0035304E8C